MINERSSQAFLIGDNSGGESGEKGNTGQCDTLKASKPSEKTARESFNVGKTELGDDMGEQRDSVR